MKLLTIINFNIRTDKELEKKLKETYPFLEIKTIIDDNLVSMPGGKELDAWEIIDRLVLEDPMSHVLVTTAHPIHEYDMELEQNSKIGGITYLEPPFNISVVSSEDSLIEGDLTRKSIHEVGHTFGLNNHYSNPRNRKQCPMVIPEYLSGNAQSEGYKLCGLCQKRVNPNYIRIIR